MIGLDEEGARSAGKPVAAPLPGARLHSVAVIGSFRRCYAEVVGAIDAFRRAGLLVTSPSGARVIDPSVAFVRFDTDDEELTDVEIQSVTLERIFEAEVTYVVAPDGYVGRTTCYEIGRLMQSRRLVYFSHQPEDLPIGIPASFVASPARLVEILGAGTSLESLRDERDDLLSIVERGLIQ